MFYPPPTRFDSHLFENPLKCAAVGINPAVHGGAVGAHTLPGVLPKGAIVVAGMLQVQTDFSSAADTSTLALHLVGAADILVAAAASALPAGLYDLVTEWNDASSAVGPLAADTNLVATYAVEAMDSGIAVCYLWYFMQRQYRY